MYSPGDVFHKVINIAHVFVVSFVLPLDMGNATSLKAVASSDHGSQESFDIELNGILWQCQVT